VLSDSAPTHRGPPSLPAWGHAVGIISLGVPIWPADLEATAARQLITERIARYCWAYDERRSGALAGCFIEDATWEGNVLGRVRVGPLRGREAIVKWLSDFWPHQHDQRRHMLLNTIVDAQEPATATTLSYLLLLSSDSKQVRVETTGFYRVSYRRLGGDWLIDRMTAGFDAPFWPGDIEKMSAAGRIRHGVEPQ
jgi:SnoaL-like domain